jgi:hypothetical protein
MLRARVGFLYLAFSGEAKGLSRAPVQSPKCGSDTTKAVTFRSHRSFYSSEEESIMNDSKHGKGDSPFADDLERNPGIGQSKGSFATGVPPQAIEGENTVEGDAENDSTANDGVPQEERERTNS